MTRHTRSAARAGSVLIAVLIVVVVLALVAYRFSDSMSAEYRAAARTADTTRARAAAVSGVNWAAAALADRDTFNNDFGGDPTTAAIAPVVVWTDPQNAQRQAKFQLVSVAVLGGGTYEQRSALTDEAGKLNINAMIAQDKTGVALYNALLKLQDVVPDLTDDVAANIVDWVDSDDNAGSAAGGTGGAENAYYQALSKPYQCKNGPLNSIDELLLVKGVTPQLLYGTDKNQNGVGDEPGAGQFGRGLADYVTIYGREVSVDSSGQLKVWINGDDPKAIYAALQTAVGGEMAAYIMAVKLFGSTNLDANGNPVGGGGASGGTTTTTTTTGKGGKGSRGGGGTTTTTTTTTAQAVQVGSLDQLVSAVESKLASTTTSGRAINSVIDLQRTRVTLPKASGGGGSGGGGMQQSTVYNSPLNDPSQLGELLPVLLDKVATKEAVDIVPRVNVNTAPREVIAGLFAAASASSNNPQLLTDAEVDTVMSARAGVSPGDPAYTSAAWLVTQANLSKAQFKAVEKYVTGTSMVYRVQAIGYLTGGGPVARVEAVIDTNLGAPRVVYFRDLGDLDNPRGFTPPKE